MRPIKVTRCAGALRAALMHFLAERFAQASQHKATHNISLKFLFRLAPTVQKR
jgi:hypothetical protein